MFYFTYFCIWIHIIANNNNNRIKNGLFCKIINIMLHQIDIICYMLLNHLWYYGYSFLNRVQNLLKTFRDTPTMIFKYIFLLQIQYHWQYLKRQSLLRSYHSIPHQILTLGCLQWDWRNLGNGFDRFSGPWTDVRMSMVSMQMKFAEFLLWWKYEVFWYYFKFILIYFQ